MTWKSDDCLPLSAAERIGAYARQMQLGCVKRCESCATVKPVFYFATYGAQECQACIQETLDVWWERQKAKVAS